MSNRLASLKAGDYCTTDCFPPITEFTPAHWVCYLFQHSLPLTAFSIITIHFSVLAKQLAYKNIINSLRSMMMT